MRERKEENGSVRGRRGYGLDCYWCGSLFKPTNCILRMFSFSFFLFITKTLMIMILLSYFLPLLLFCVYSLLGSFLLSLTRSFFFPSFERRTCVSIEWKHERKCRIYFLSLSFLPFFSLFLIIMFFSMTRFLS